MMTESKKTLYIVVDALRSDYVTVGKMPRLTELANKSVYVQQVVPSPGFCERVEILTGKENLETGYFTAIDRINGQHKNSFLFNAFAFGVSLVRMIESFFKSYLIFRIRKRFTTIIMRKFWPKYDVPPFNIPLSIYGQFGLSEDAVDQSLPFAFGVPSVVDRQSERNQSVNFEAFTSLTETSSLLTDEDRMSFIESNFHASADSTFFLYLGQLDAMGHKWGPTSREFIKILNSFDETLDCFIQKIITAGDFELIIIGDHGMSDVTECVDFQGEVIKEARRLGLNNREDFVVFCDSTVGRIWIRDPEHLSLLRDRLEKNHTLKEHGLVFKNEDYEKYSVPNNPDPHGHILWFAKNGVVVSPDYFYGPFSPKGMHGYLPLVKENFGMALFFGSNVDPEAIHKAKLSDVPAIYDRVFGNITHE